MHITVVPASPKTGQAAIRALLADASNPIVRGVYRDLSRVPAEFRSNPRFEAVQGTVEDAATLDFSGSDAVFNITPPLYQEIEIDIVAHARQVSENVKAAVKKAESVRRLVLLTSVGAQYDHGTGEILTNHEAEVVLRDAAPEVVFVRASYFMENWATSLETLPAGYFFTTVTPVDRPLSMIAVQDIGSTCAAEALATGTSLPSNPHIFELHGPREYSSLDVQKAFEEVTGKSVEMRPVEKDGLDDFYAAVFPPKVAKEFTAMNKSFLEGGIMYEDPQPTGEKKYGKTELVEVVKQLLGA
ncbi:hypothetical protein C7999DRAFT_33740 [Corynascus novoguineensis]|uniref:NmrA-like domain-containing protein n=1 Tax=Corynascus novoguineensis TaxID=1126955 RepID=A0AAN7HLL7_9PEZI|nr:hypothetical protein C7999DRAFT_33740 [Corynascus novoguineensis]